MVRWLSPSGLSTTSAQLLLSGIFGAYADKREIQAALKEPSGIDLSNRPGLTLDFMADTGDGFNPTYAVARALAEPHLPVADGAQELRLPRGQVLVLGGDIAYPAASRDEFQNRFALRRCLSRPRGWAARSTPGVPCEGADGHQEGDDEQRGGERSRVLDECIHEGPGRSLTPRGDQPDDVILHAERQPAHDQEREERSKVQLRERPPAVQGDERRSDDEDQRHEDDQRDRPFRERLACGRVVSRVSSSSTTS
jgi:hypothetical protein